MGDAVLRLWVQVKAEAKEDRLEFSDETHAVVCVRAPRLKGKANAAVLKLLKRHYGRQARMVSGATSSEKIIEVDDE